VLGTSFRVNPNGIAPDGVNGLKRETLKGGQHGIQRNHALEGYWDLLSFVRAWLYRAGVIWGNPAIGFRVLRFGQIALHHSEFRVWRRL
jgi:hypothetical protein